MELSGSNIKKFLIFFQKKAFFYISGNGTFLYFRKQKPSKTSHISQSNIPSWENQKKPL